MRITNRATMPNAQHRLSRVSKVILITVAILSSLLTVAGPTAEAQSSDCGPTNFTDVPDHKYFTAAVAWAACNGITNGTSATTFSPDAPVTRAQMATFLWRFAGRPSGGSHSFVDVPAGSYFDQPVGWLRSSGITTGTSPTTFSPHSIVNRGQMATFLWRYSDRPASTTSTPFTDVPPSAYYARPVAWMNETGITNGTSATTFSPAQPLNRAEAVTFLWRLSQVPPKNPPLPVWDGDQISVTSVGRFDFTISWPGVVGAHTMQLKITSSDGDVSWEGIDPARYSSYTVNKMQGYALDPSVSYSLELYAANTAGRQSQPLTFEGLKLVTIDWTSAETVIRPEGLGRNAVGRVPHAEQSTQPGLYRATGTSSAECTELSTTFFGKVDAGFWSTGIHGSRFVQHTATSTLCRNGSVVTENFADFQRCEVLAGEETDLPVEDPKQTPASEFPNSAVVKNVWLCPLAGEVDVELSLDGVNVSTKIRYDAQHEIHHVVRVVNGQYSWTSDAWLS